jgi:Na+-transporting NADH:ubiquinone oxidoreductase subunit NqrF
MPPSPLIGEKMLLTILLSAPFIVLYCAIVLAIVGVILIKRFPIAEKGDIVGIITTKRRGGKND